MAVLATKLGSSLKLKYSLGLNEKGIEKFKIITLKNIKSTISDDDLFTLSGHLKELQNNTLVSVTKIDDTKLSE